MSFRVIEALDGVAQRLTALASEVSAAETYNRAHVDLSGLGDSGIFVTATAVLDDIQAAVDAELAHLRRLTSSSAQELHATARQYRSTDEAAAARLDASYGGGCDAGHSSTRPGGAR